MSSAQYPFQTLPIIDAGSETAPDGSNVRPLLRFPSGSMAHFEFSSGKVSHPVRHPERDELWYVIDGGGEMWRQQDERSSIEPLAPGTCVSIPCNTAFQCRAGSGGMTVIAVTLPAWSGDTNAVAAVGPWKPRPF